MCDFETIVCCVIVQFVLGYCRPLSVALQGTCCDLVRAHRDARSLVSAIDKLRNSKFTELYSRAVTIAAKVGTKPQKPRTTGRQTKRANAVITAQTESDPISEYYRVNTFLPFVDHVLQYMEDRFPEELAPAMTAWYLIPCNTASLSKSIVDKICKEFEVDLPSSMTFSQEVDRWKLCCDDADTKRITTLAGALRIAAPMNLFPNITAILQLLMTLPVGSCCCERSFSTMRRLRTWQRSSMAESRFNGLALMSIHKDITVELDAVLRRFDTGNRRIGHLFESPDTVADTMDETDEIDDVGGSRYTDDDEEDILNELLSTSLSQLM